MDKSKDSIDFGGDKWKFDADVTECFGDMLQRSIPSYSLMRDLCYRVGRNFLSSVGGLVSDLGCSDGLSVVRLVREYPNVDFVLSDVSDPMLAACRLRFAGNSNVRVVSHDLRKGVCTSGNDLVLCVLTLQFTPIEYRQDILQSIYDSLRVGGGFILVEKVLGESSAIDSLLVGEYYDMKRMNGYTEELIQSKRKSLEGVLVPLTADFDVHLLRNVGFRKIDCFWRCLNFCAWVAIK